MKTTIRAAVAVIVSAVCCSTARAEDYTYLSGDPELDASWIGGVKPATSDNVIFGADAAAAIFPVNQDLTFARFTVNDTERELSLSFTGTDTSVTNILDLMPDGLYVGANADLTVSGIGVVTAKVLSVASNSKLTMSNGAHIHSTRGYNAKNNGYRETSDFGIYMSGGAQWVVNNSGSVNSGSEWGIGNNSEFILDGQNTMCHWVESHCQLGSDSRLVIKNGAKFTCKLFRPSYAGCSISILDGGAFSNSGVTDFVGSTFSITNSAYKMNGNNVTVKSNTRFLLGANSYVTNVNLKVWDSYICIDGENEHAYYHITDNILLAKESVIEVKNKGSLYWRTVGLASNVNIVVDNGAFACRDWNHISPWGATGDNGGVVSGAKVQVRNSGSFTAKNEAVFQGTNFVFEIKSDSTATWDGSVYLGVPADKTEKIPHYAPAISISGINSSFNVNGAMFYAGSRNELYEALPKLHFEIPSTPWTTAPVQVSKTAMLDANFIVDVDVAEELKGQRVIVPLLTAGTLQVADIDAMNEFARLPDGATLKVGNYNAGIKKWEAAAGGKTLFVDIPSQNGMIIIVK